MIGKLWAGLFGLLAFALSLVGANWAGKRSGRTEERARHLQRDVDAAKDVKDRHKEVQDESRDSLIDRLTDE